MEGADAILATKPVLMQNPGYGYNDLYYSKANSTISLLEATANWSNTLSLSSLQFGGSSQVQLPIDQFVSHVVLRLRIPNLVANQSVCRGWGYRMLQQINFIFGASSSISSTLNTDAILQTLFAQCENAEMRDEILRLGGEERLAPIVPAPGEPDYLEAYCLIPLPMSALCDSTLPVDSTMLSNNIVVGIIFDQAQAIYGGSGARPTQFLAAELSLHQLKLSDQSSSLRNAMISSPGLLYVFPFVLHQSFQTPSFQGVQEGNGKVSTILQSFGAGDLLGIHWWVIRDDFKNPTAGSTPNPWCCDEISNIEIEFNGSVLYRSNGKAYKLMNMLSKASGGGYFDASIVSPGAVQPFVSNPIKCYPIFFDLSRLRSACFPGEHQFNTLRMTNNNLIVRFNTTGTGSYRLYACYHYNASLTFADGVSSISV